mgnify:FL=1
MQGQVKFFNMTKGIGFVAGADGREYFVHFSDVEPAGDPPLHVLLPEWEVEFEAVKTRRGWQAKKVVPRRRPGLTINAALPPTPRLDGQRNINLRIDALGRVYALAGQATTPAIETPGHFRAYYLGPTGPGKMVGFDLNLPAPDSQRAYVLLDQDKNPRRVKADGVYQGVVASSYFMKVEKDGNVRVQSLGRRHGAGHNWLILEDRFVHLYNLSHASRESLTAQTPTSGLARDNDGFVRGILRACEYMAATV